MLPRGLLMSRSATVLPSIELGRSSRVRVVTVRSPVGSRMVLLMAAPAGSACGDSSRRDLAGRGLAPGRPVGPAADDGREQARSAACVDDQQPALAELRQA